MPDFFPPYETLSLCRVVGGRVREALCVGSAKHARVLSCSVLKGRNVTPKHIKRIPKFCEACHLGFMAARRDARFCSARCRQASHRAKSVTEASRHDVAPVTKPPKPKSQQSLDIDVAKAWIEWSHDEKPTL